jgi:hypothetical protein
MIGNSFCRQIHSHGGVCVVIKKNQFNSINLDQYNKEKDIETYALKFKFMSKIVIIICIYRSPMGNFSYFLNQLELILNKVYNPSNEIILCSNLM